MLLMTYREKNTTYVSHGIMESTLKNVCVSPDPLSYYISIGAKMDYDLGEYYLEVNEE